MVGSRRDQQHNGDRDRTHACRVNRLRCRAQFAETIGQHGDHLEAEQRLGARQNDAQFREPLNDACFQCLLLVLHGTVLSFSASGRARRNHVPDHDAHKHETAARKSRAPDTGNRDEADRHVDTKHQCEQWQCRL